MTHLYPNLQNKYEIPENVAQGIIKVGQKCKEEGVTYIFISLLLPQRNQAACKKEVEVNVMLSILCDEHGFKFINNANFMVMDLWKDGIHPIIDTDAKDIGSSKLSNNFITALKSSC